MRTYLFGNGLSISFDPNLYNLDKLTVSVRDRLLNLSLPSGEPLLAGLQAISDSLTDSRIDLMTTSGFEDFAAPVDTVAAVIPEIEPLSRLSGDPHVREVLAILADDMVAIHRRVIGAVLEFVMSHVGQDEIMWASSVNPVARHLANVAEEQAFVNTFTLNYDALLDSALLECCKYKDIKLKDEFSGHPDDKRIHWINDAPIEALRWQNDAYSPGTPLIRLFHLHGAGNWLQREMGVWKAASLKELRDAGIFTAWAQGKLHDSHPVVVLGRSKERATQQPPFSHSYERLAFSVETSDAVILAGYGFKDAPVNRAIRQGLTWNTQVLVINPEKDIEETAREALKMSPTDSRLHVITKGLPAGLDLVP